jgi:TIR domain
VKASARIVTEQDAGFAMFNQYDPWTLAELQSAKRRDEERLLEKAAKQSQRVVVEPKIQIDMSTTSQPKIFVSHSHKDDAFTECLVGDLRQAGANAWMDNTGLGAGNFQQRISEALADCEWFVLVLTRDALVSSWVRQEVDAANRLKNQGKIHDLIFRYHLDLCVTMCYDPRLNE